MQRAFSLFFLALMSIPLDAQLKTCLSLEAGPHWSFVKVDDPGDRFRSANVNSSIAGFTVEQEVMKNLSVVTGLYFQSYKTGLNMIDDRRQQQRLHSHNALMIPLRIQYRVQPSEYPVSFIPRVGYLLSMNSTSGDLFYNTSVLSSPDGTAFSYVQEQLPDEKNRHLLELGAGVSLRFSGLWQASVSLSYITGVLNPPATSFTLDYTDQQGNDRSAEYSTKGNGIYSSLALQIPVSSIWQNRDYRIRARIENSVYEGKPVERKGQFYAGGEFGSLWRLFHTTNPAIGARPMEGRGLFRYANFHAGGYVGYMLANELGMDLGVNYQRSSTFYALMYDHQVDFVQETGAPIYLEVPLRFRYFYNLYKEKIYAVACAGASLLTHFSSGGYEGPGGNFTYTSPGSQSAVDATVSSTPLRLSRFRPVLRLGAGVEYLLPIRFPLFATGYINYLQGFMAAEETSISTSIPESPEASSLTYNGSGWSVDLGIKIPFSSDDREDCVKLPVKREKKERGERRRE
jgi:hypothetical protein